MTTTATQFLNIEEEALKGWLQHRVSEERYHHSLGAQQKAIELARGFKLPNEAIEKAAVAGLLHDAAKLLTPEQLLTECEKMGMPLTDEDRSAPQTLHPFVGAELVRREFNLHDEETLNAIRYHTTGRRSMTPVEKVVYIADKIEGNTRNPLYTQKITALLNFAEPETLDKAMLFILESTITFLIEKGQLIHPRTIEARNDLVGRLKAHRNPNTHSRKPVT